MVFIQEGFRFKQDDICFYSQAFTRRVHKENCQKIVAIKRIELFYCKKRGDVFFFSHTSVLLTKKVLGPIREKTS